MLLGAIADDLTGATDLALTLSREGMRTALVVGAPDGAVDTTGVDAVVVSLKTRTIPAAEAVAQSLAAGRALLAAGARQLFFKYCSTFDSTDDGNIGPVIAALLDLVGTPLTLACPAFPTNQRTVYKGHLFVGDALISDSPMRDHPLTPMRDPNLVRVLQRQTKLPIGLIPHETVAAGPAAIAESLAAAEAGGGVVIIDAIQDDDLRAIGHAAVNLKLITGGSGMALGLPANYRADGSLRPKAPEMWMKAPVGHSVILAGSCSAATRRQVTVAKAAGLPSFQLDPLKIAQGQITAAEVATFVEANAFDRVPLVYSSADPATVRAVQEVIGRDQAGLLVEFILADIAARLAVRGFTRFVVAGGETSGAVVQALGVKALRVGPEIDPGVPWTMATKSPAPVALALKSGNFGTDDFFLKAWELLQ